MDIAQALDKLGFMDENCASDMANYAALKKTWRHSRAIPSEAEVIAANAEIEAAQAANQYKDVRREAYPEIADFADAYYWAQKGDDSLMTAYVAALAKVKSDNPKP